MWNLSDKLILGIWIKYRYDSEINKGKANKLGLITLFQFGELITIWNKGKSIWNIREKERGRDINAMYLA